MTRSVSQFVTATPQRICVCYDSSFSEMVNVLEQNTDMISAHVIRHVEVN